MDRQEALAKLQATELEILVAFSNYCRKHNIPWFMDSGTVLGAKRHGGFIPWDDDIDVGMLAQITIVSSAYLRVASLRGIPYIPQE